MELSISTITSVSYLNLKEIDLPKLYDLLQTDKNIIFIELGNKYKGLINEKNLKKRNNNKKKYFYNQITLNYKPSNKKQEKPNDKDISECLHYILNNLTKNFIKKFNLTESNIDCLKEHTIIKIFKSLKRSNYKKYVSKHEKLSKIVNYYYNSFKLINVKIFNNGSLQFTGLEYINQGTDITNELIVKMIYYKFLNKKDNISLLENKIVMINSDLNVKFKINRSKLHGYMVQNNYYSSYEPIMYPGVNIKYFYNKINKNQGICNCNCICDGKGNANGDGKCKSITIAVFNSGAIIITGGRTLEQCYKAHEFITNILLNDKYKFYEIDNDRLKSATIIYKYYQKYKRNKMK
jgi:TATA-box binding protein (TBP) (component of TFIID and TFIIIB)